MDWIQSGLEKHRRPDGRALKQPGEPAQTTTSTPAVTKVVVPIEITKSGTSHGWIGYRVDSEAPQTRRKSAQATRRACPNYDLHTCGDQGGRPYRNNQIGHFARMDWTQRRLRGTADPTEEHSDDQESLPKIRHNCS